MLSTSVHSSNIKGLSNLKSQEDHLRASVRSSLIALAFRIPTRKDNIYALFLGLPCDIWKFIASYSLVPQPLLPVHSIPFLQFLNANRALAQCPRDTSLCVNVLITVWQVTLCLFNVSFSNHKIIFHSECLPRTACPR